MVDFTIIIPHRGNPMGLWATINSAQIDLLHNSPDVSYNFVIVTNGDPKEKVETSAIYHLGESGHLLKHIHQDNALTPQDARQIGVREADGKYLAFFDNHCLIGSPGYFKKAKILMDYYEDMAILHSTTMFYTGLAPAYHYQLRLDYNFWASAALTPYRPCRYRIAAGGHGGFFVRRDVFNAMGGYGPIGLMNGYAGEELLFDLKAARYGYHNYIHPDVIHYHFAGDRGYVRHFTDDYYRNLLICAHVVGGETWLYRLFNSFITKHHLRMNPVFEWYEILEQAYTRSAQYAAEVAKNSSMTLDELLLYFAEQDVAF